MGGKGQHMALLSTVIAVILLKAGPQHLPASRQLLGTTILLYMLTGMLILLPELGAAPALGNMLLDTVILTSFCYFALLMLGFTSRVVQTLTTLAATGVVFHLLAWPLLAHINSMQAQEQVAMIESLLMLSLLAWQILVNAHIFRYALEINMGRAVALSFGYLFLSIATSQVAFG
jgi:type III secretory pathway component EscU